MNSVSINIISALSPILMALIGWLGTEAAKLVRAKTNNEMFAAAAKRLTDAVVTAVAEMEQTIVKEAKLRSLDGSLSPEDVAAIKQAALNKAKSYLGADGVTLLLRVLKLDETGLDSYIRGKIEAAVLESKPKMPPFVPLAKLPPFLASAQATAFQNAQLLKKEEG